MEENQPAPTSRVSVTPETSQPTTNPEAPPASKGSETPPSAKPAAKQIFTAPKPVQLPAKKSGWGRIILLLLCLGVGVGSGAFAKRMFAPPPPEDPHPAPDASDEEDEADQHLTRFEPGKEVEALRNIDTHIIEGRLPQAIKLALKVIAQTSGATRISTQYRLGIAQEAKGQWAEANTTYDSLVAEGELSTVTFAALLGQLRCRFYLHRDDEVRMSLARFELLSGHPDMQTFPFSGEVQHIRAMVAMEKIPHTSRPSPFSKSELAWVKKTIDVTRYLTWADPPKNTKEAQDASPHAFPKTPQIEVQPHPTERSLQRVGVQCNTTPVQTILKGLLEKTGLQLRSSPEIEEQISGRRRQVIVSGMPLGDFLTALVEPYDVVWTIEEDTLKLTAAPEHPPSPEERRASVRILLRKALLAAPVHPLNPATTLELGNLEFIDGHSKEAIGWYEKLVVDPSQTREALCACYNLGLTYLREFEDEPARKMFIEVVDRGVDPNWIALGWWWVGRTYLDSGKATEAIRPFEKAIATAPETSTHTLAVLGIVASHLSLGDNVAAHDVIKAHRRELMKEQRCRKEAAFFDALARYRQARKDNFRRSEEEEDVVRCLIGLNDTSEVGWLGIVLQGEAWNQLGMGSWMNQVYRKHLEELRGPVAIIMISQLGEYYFDELRFDDARQYFLAVVAVDRTGLRDHARARLAEIALQQHQWDACLSHCDYLIRHVPEYRRKSLKLMGHAFQAKGDYVRAAESFAGINK